MGSRPAKGEVQHSHEPKPQERASIEIDAGKMIARLQQQRAELQQQLDFAEIALSDEQEKVANLIARIAELEDRA